MLNKSDLYRCLADCSVQSIRHEYSRAFGRGVMVDMSELVAEGVALGDLLEDAMHLFEPIEPEAPPPPVAEPEEEEA